MEQIQDQAGVCSKKASGIDLLRTMTTAREMDRREGILYRQGRGWFQLPGAGHEAFAACAPHLRPDDYLYLYYRDRALMLARGATVREIAAGFFGKSDSSSGGRQMSSHFNSAALNVVSCASPTGLQCLPAAGSAWACRRAGRGQIVLCTIGDAAVREGEFYEALCFSIEKCLPIVFLVEDNGFGVSTRTAGMNPFAMGALGSDYLRQFDGREIDLVDREFAAATERARAGGGPTVLWAEVDRLMSHTSSDDHRIYRSHEELDLMQRRDPIGSLLERLSSANLVCQAGWDSEVESIATSVERVYDDAFRSPAPDAGSASRHVFSGIPLPKAASGLGLNKPWTIVSALNKTLASLLESDENVILFGEDIEDPKGGVFGFTKGLSYAHPGRVVNSPLAEATIAGTAAGLAIGGLKPIFELQFIDFVGPAFNQIVNQIATLRWRTEGAWKCPLVLLAPCGAYLPGGGPWHSQTNESWFAHAPGLQVVIPSNPFDSAALLRAAVGGEDPVLFLIPKHLSRKEVELATPAPPIALGQASVVIEGSDVTVLAWGNCVELAENAAHASALRGISVEVVDLRSIVPCDWETIDASLSKTGRLVVVQEDNRTCSFGQALIAEVVSTQRRWNLLSAAPQLISRPDVHVGFHPELERAVLPDVTAVIDACVRIARM